MWRPAHSCCKMMPDIKKLISARLAGNILIVSLSLLMIFHVLVLFRFAPVEIVWGGQIADSPADLIALEGFALFITAVFLLIVSCKLGYIKSSSFIKIINTGLWIVFVYLIMNLSANLVSKSFFENLIFIPITLIMAILVYRLILEK